MNILILGTSPVLSKNLTDSLEKKGHTYKYYKPNELYLYVSEHENGNDRLYWGNPETNEVERVYVKNFDAVITRIGWGLDYAASILTHLTENLGIYSPQSAEGLVTASNKMKTTQKLSYAGVRVPRTVMAQTPVHADFLIKKIGGLPAVGKLLQGSQGKGVMILRDAEQTNMSLETFAKLEANIQIQAYIEGGGKDIRAIVVGDKVVVALERTGKKDFRANLSRGGSGKAIELTEQEKTMCVKMAKAIGLECAGVDILRGQDGYTYGIEVNGNFGEKIISITGVNFFENIIDHIQANYKSGSKKDVSLQSDDEIISSFLPHTFPSIAVAYENGSLSKKEILSMAKAYFKL